MEDNSKINNKTIKNLFLIGLLAIIAYGLLVVGDMYKNEKNLSIFLDNAKNISQGDVVGLNFSSAVNGKYNMDNISIEPALKFKAKFINNKKAELTIVEAPIPDQTYFIKVNNIPTFWFNLKKDIKTKFTSVQTPAKVSVIPKNGEKEVGYQQNIEISLEKPLEDGIFLEVDMEPNIDVDVSVNNNKDNIILSPKKDLEKGQKYEIVITAKYRDQKAFSKNIYKGEFFTKVPPQVVYGFDKNGEPNKTEDITWEITPKIAEGKYIDIDLTHQVMSIFQDGLRKGAYKVSTGKRGMDTPTGTFRILSKRRRPWSAHYGLYMPWFMGFTTMGHGIHELPEWPSGYKEGANHLGIPVSHGCVRLGIGPAKLVYDFTEKGTPVVVHY